MIRIRKETKGWIAMALVLTVVVTLVLVLLGLVGYWRDPRRGVLALAGTLLGAILVGFWGEPWGQDLAKRFGGDPRALTFAVSSAAFLFAALVVGYGGGTLLGQIKERPSFPRRLAGALLGLINGALIVGYILRFATGTNPSLGETVQGTPLARLFHDGLPLLFLAVTIVTAALVLVRALLLAAGAWRARPAQPAADARPQAQARVGGPPTQPER
jgi:uncharacterized membrane protein required for colicin V production